MREIILAPRRKGLRRYATGLWSANDGDRPLAPYLGRGCAFGLRFYQHVGRNFSKQHEQLQTRLRASPPTAIWERRVGSSVRWQSAPEIVIFAKSQPRAQEAANLLLASILLIGGP